MPFKAPEVKLFWSNSNRSSPTERETLTQEKDTLNIRWTFYVGSAGWQDRFN